MKTAPTRAWYRLHWLTWLSIGLMSFAFAYCETRKHVNDMWMSIGYLTHSHYGWPSHHLEVTERGGGSRPPTFENRWQLQGIVANALTCIAFLLCTACAFESFQRMPNRWQFTLQQLMFISTMLGLLLATAKIDLVLPPASIDWQNYYSFHLTNPWDCVLLFGFICTVCTVSWWTCNLVVSISARVLRKRSA